MKDYSTSLEERKDFILGYNITKDGQMIVKFAKGKPWTIPYNEENEKILLDKMEKQLAESYQYNIKIIGMKKNTMFFTIGFLLCSALFTLFGVNVEFLTAFAYAGAFLGALSVIFGTISIRCCCILKDLEKNKKFLRIEQKLNSNVRSNQNVLVNVSNKTKKVINGFPEDKPVFNINSFNYVPFRDLEQIVENVDRNERFSFIYEETEQVDEPKTRKKVKE